MNRTFIVQQAWESDATPLSSLTITPEGIFPVTVCIFKKQFPLLCHKVALECIDEVSEAQMKLL